MKKYILCISLLAALSMGATAGKNGGLKSHLVEVGKGYSQTSVNTAVFRTNSIVTHGNEQYISYYDGDGYLTLGKRRLGSEEWLIERSMYKGKVTDGHNIISMAVDGDGYVHVAFDHHGNRLNYCRGIEPGSLKLGGKILMTAFDENNVTYPEFYLMKDGSLLFVYRSGSSGRGNLVMNRYSLETRTWERVHNVLIDGEDKRNAYWQMYVDESGVIHLSWVWRETWKVETNHDLCYAKSEDGGRTWKKSNGEPYTLPITQNSAEYAAYIPQGYELINQTSMSTDKDGHPYIATYWRSGNSDIPQYRLVWHDGLQWHEEQVSDRKTPFTLKGGGTKMIPIARPRIVTDGKRAWYIVRDEERGSKVSVYYKKNINKRKPWVLSDITDFPVNAWEPSYDTELWKLQKKLHIFVQDTHQGDGEKTVKSEPTSVYVLELEK